MDSGDVISKELHLLKRSQNLLLQSNLYSIW